MIENPTEDKILVPSLLEWNMLQIKEIFSDKNRYHAAERLGRPANDIELCLHYSENGGSEDFAEGHERGWLKPNLNRNEEYSLV